MYQLNPFVFNYLNSQKNLSLPSTIKIAPGSTIAIIGPSGGGKTTLMKLLKGIIPEFQNGRMVGEITYKNRPLGGSFFQDNLKEILYLFQNPFSQLIYPETEEEFLFSMENFNFSKTEMDQKINEFDELFQIGELWGKKTTELSHGQCQKLVLSSLLAINPEVLLLDEPTAFLDPEARESFYDFLGKIKQEKTTIIIDHHINEISHMIDQYLFVNEKGLISLVDNPSTVLDKSEAAFNSHLEMRIAQSVSLSCKDLSFTYDQKSMVLNNVNLEFKQGEIVCLKGRNGQGKSTLLNLLSGVLRPSAGEIKLLINQKEIKIRNFYKEVGIVFQSPESHFYFDTIKEELDQCQKIQGELREQLIKAFFYDLDLEKSPFLLSEGEKRRLSILMTVLLGKKIIFYDEPTFGQDDRSIKEITAIFKALKLSDVTQIFISHDEDFISALADRVLILKEGEVIE